MKPHTSKDKGKQQIVKLGFFKRLFGGDPAQRRANRILKRELNAARLDLYKIKHDLIQVPIAKNLFEIYKLTYPFRQLFAFDSSTKRFPPSFDESFILYFHTEEELDMYNKLTEEHIKKLIGKYGVKKTTVLIDKLLNDYFDRFDRERAQKIDSIYSNFLGFAKFTKFDIFPILREFDPNLEEGNFTKKTNFSPAEGSFLRNDFYKLHKAIYAFEVDKKLDQGIEIFSMIKNIEPISKSNLNRLKNLIANLQKNNYCSLIVRAIDKNIAPIPVEIPSSVNVFNNFTYKRKGDVQSLLASLKNKIKEDTVSSITSQLFDETALQRVKNYNEQKNDQLKNLGLPIFKYVKALNYIKAFMTDKYKTSINAVVNELIVSGIFINKEILNELSNCYYALENQIENITDFDNDLDAESAASRTIKRLLYTVKKDTNSKTILEKTINNINLKAKIIIEEGVINLKQMAICLKSTLEDYKRQTAVIVTNIKKIRSNSNKQFIEELLSAYKDMYLFLKLLSNYVSLSISRSELEKQKVSVRD